MTLCSLLLDIFYYDPSVGIKVGFDYIKQCQLPLELLNLLPLQYLQIKSHYSMKRTLLCRKIKFMVVLETMDYNIMDIISKGPHIPVFQKTKDGVAGELKKKTHTRA